MNHTIRPGEPLKDVVMRHILVTLNSLGGNQVQAAKALGISRNGLRYKLYGYERDRRKA